MLAKCEEEYLLKPNLLYFQLLLLFVCITFLKCEEQAPFHLS